MSATDRQTDRHTDRQTDRQDRQRDRQFAENLANMFKNPMKNMLKFTSEGAPLKGDPSPANFNMFFEQLANQLSSPFVRGEHMVNVCLV